MQKVVTINLNGNAYQLDESGYERLRAYLDRAAAQLRDNPDRAEIIADLEQAIAEKCAAHLAAHKTVVTAEEVEQILKDMGPVNDPEAQPAAEGAKTSSETSDEKKTTDGAAPKRLYQIREGAMLTGVCNGIAAYFNVDVTLVRIAFVVLAILTKGIWVIAYVVMSLVIPFATTAEERAAARGMPFSAQDMIDQAKDNYRNFRASTKWRRQRARWRREWRRTMRAGGIHIAAGPIPPAGAAQANYALQVWAGVVTPFLALGRAVLLVVLALAILSLVQDGDVFGWLPPADLPLWMGVLGLVIAYHLAASPFRAIEAGLSRHRSQATEAWTGLLTLAVTLFVLWLAYHNVPEFREFVQDIPDMWQSIVDSFRDWQRNR
jgi:phage shock protein PspC (stress-responsive transcriptional regulator)